MLLPTLIILSLLQGVAEFLPISSSGHLILAMRFLGLQHADNTTLALALHCGTTLAVIAYYRGTIRDIIAGLLTGEKKVAKHALEICLSTVPLVIVYMGLNRLIEPYSSNLNVIASMLLVSGAVLLSLRIWPPNLDESVSDDAREPVGWRRALLVGAAQAAAIVPGISRLGMTATMARRLGFSGSRATQFSFFINIPLLAGATLVSIISHIKSGSWGLGCDRMWLGVMIAGVAGYLALSLLIKILSGSRFWIFGVYCVLMGIVILCLT